MVSKVHKIFQESSPLGLKLPKLHSWVYHIIDSIKFFGAINGYTTETYESLHKEYVKTPYQLSNRKNIETQMMKMASIKKSMKRVIYKKITQYLHNITSIG